jgi:hypothetical protein
VTANELNSDRQQDSRERDYGKQHTKCYAGDDAKPNVTGHPTQSKIPIAMHAPHWATRKDLTVGVYLQAITRNGW